MLGKHFCRFAVLATVAATSSAAFAQFGFPPRPGGGFSSDAMFDRLDDDGSGVIEPEEIENSRMRFMVDRMGLDTSKNISREDYSEASDRMRKRFEEGGGFGGWGGRDRDDDDDSDEDDDRRRRWSGWGRGDDNDSPWGRDRSRSRGESRTADAGDQPPPRVTVDLPADYIPGDTDRDGQIGLYEWTQWKSRAALGQFLGLDRDRDGFLTPRELSRASEATPVDVATFFSAAPVPASRSSAAPINASTGTVTTPETQTPSAAPIPKQLDPTNTQEVIAAADQSVVKQAERLFGLLDNNRDGNVSEDEWTRSRKLKPLFEKAGVDLAQPMTSDQFVSYYVRITAPDESI